MKNVLVIGSGWRAETWLKIINRLPDFKTEALVCRNPQKAVVFSEKFGVSTVASISDALGKSFDFALVCVSKGDNAAVSESLLRSGVPVLCETPAGVTDEERKRLYLYDGSNFQFAEQYPLRPRYIAMNALVEKNYFGKLHTISLSCCHAYHAVALMRAFLKTGEELPEAHVLSLSDVYTETDGRTGRKPPETLSHERRVALLKFGDKTAFYDFSHGQYFSRIRGERLLLQGTDGEMSNGEGWRVNNGEELPISLRCRYSGQGNSLAAPDLVEISCDGEILFKNPYFGCRLSEEEIAMASCLTAFADGLKSGIPFYSARQAAIDSLIADRL